MPSKILKNKTLGGLGIEIDRRLSKVVRRASKDAGYVYVGSISQRHERPIRKNKQRPRIREGEYGEKLSAVPMSMVSNAASGLEGRDKRCVTLGLASKSTQTGTWRGSTYSPRETIFHPEQASTSRRQKRGTLSSVIVIDSFGFAGRPDKGQHT